MHTFVAVFSIEKENQIYRCHLKNYKKIAQKNSNKKVTNSFYLISDSGVYRHTKLSVAFSALFSAIHFFIFRVKHKQTSVTDIVPICTDQNKM